MTLHVDIPMHRNSYAAKEETNAAKDGIWIQYITKSKELPWIVLCHYSKQSSKMPSSWICLRLTKSFNYFRQQVSCQWETWWGNPTHHELFWKPPIEVDSPYVALPLKNDKWLYAPLSSDILGIFKSQDIRLIGKMYP